MDNPFEHLVAKLNNIESVQQEILDSINKKNKDQIKQEFLDVEQTAKFLGMAVPTVYTKVSKREIPAMKKGGKLYFSMPELVEWIKSGKKKSVDEVKSSSQINLPLDKKK